jgi:hypothetical protein
MPKTRKITKTQSRVSAFSRPRASKYHPSICVHANKPTPSMFTQNTATRQQARAAARRIEYNKLGVGQHSRPVFDLPRKTLRSIARDIVKRQWRERRGLDVRS